MPSYNKVLLMGNLTRDPELRYTANNQAVCNVGLAVNRRYQTTDGQQREEVAFIDCEAWGRRAEVINQYLAKGRPVFVEGRLRLDSWEDQQGQKRSKLKVVIENFEFIDSRGGASDSGDAYQNDRNGSHSTSSAVTGSGPHTPIEDDDIPF